MPPRTHHRGALALALFVSAAFLASAQLQSPLPPPGPGPSGGNGTRYLVRFTAGTSPASRAAAVQRAGAALRYNFQTQDTAAITAADANVLNALRQDRTVVEILPDGRIYALQKGSNPGKGNGGGNGGGGGSEPASFGTRQIIPVGVQRVGYPTATSDGTGIGVAVVDSGLDLTHTDLNVSATKFDAFGGTCQDSDGHGTHIAGIIAARNNNQDVLGVAPGATLYCAKVLNGGSGDESGAIAALDWIASIHNSVTPPIRVVNVSWGRLPETGETLDPPGPLRQALQTLYNLGIVVVASAGNDQTKEVSAFIPSGYPEVLAVAATVAEPGMVDPTCAGLVGPVLADTASFFTTDGAFNTSTRIGVTTSAPGDERETTVLSGFFCLLYVDGILSTRLGGGISRATPAGEAIGTSFAAPHVVGVVARLMQARGLSGVETIRSELRTTADRVGTAPLDHPWGSIIGYTFDGEREGIAQAPR
jgi:subtilisin family serine protease